MNRQREYRAWHRVQKVMLHEDKPGDVFRWLHEGQPIDVMDFTGKLDRNGVKIFEGDKIEFSLIGVVLEGVVVFDDTCFAAKVGRNTETLPLYGLMEIKVISNIYKEKQR